MSGPSPLETAQHKARYGRRDWVVWKDRSGVTHAEPCSAQSLKAALLSSGTQGEFSFIHRGCATIMHCTWNIGLNILRQLRHHNL